MNNNLKLIKEFELDCMSKGLSKLRIRKYSYTLKKISKLLRKDFTKATEKDIVKLVARIENSNFSPHTKHDYKVAIKRFYKFLGKENLVSWIKTTIKKNELPLPKIITREEVVKLVQACKTVRDKAFFYVLYESGCRIGELLNMKMSDVEFDPYGAILIVHGKTGSRRIRICGKAVEYLKEWYYVDHPTKDPNSRLFPVSYRGMDKVLKNAAKKAKLGKRVHFHMFRHGRATELASKLTEMELDIFMGWELGSDMPRTYCHLSGKDIEKKILQTYGVTKEQRIEKALSQLQFKKPELFRALVDFVRNELKNEEYEE